MENNNWFFLHDKAPGHRSDLVEYLLRKNNVTKLEHPAYSPNLAAANLYLLPRLKSSNERRDGGFVNLLTLIECDGEAEKALAK